MGYMLSSIGRFFAQRPFMTFGILIGCAIGGLLLLRSEDTRSRVLILERGQCTEKSSPKECQELFSRLLNNAGDLQERELKKLIDYSKLIRPKRVIIRRTIIQRTPATPSNPTQRPSMPRRQSQPRSTPQRPKPNVRKPHITPTLPPTNSSPSPSPNTPSTPKPPITPLPPTPPPTLDIPPIPELPIPQLPLNLNDKIPIN